MHTSPCIQSGVIIVLLDETKNESGYPMEAFVFIDDYGCWPTQDETMNPKKIMQELMKVHSFTFFLFFVQYTSLC